jgi:hypothetical protein
MKVEREKEMDIIEHAVRKGIRSVGRDADDETVALIVQRVRENHPERERVPKRAPYAFYAGRNWAISVHRKELAAPRVAEKLLKKQIRELEQQVVTLTHQELKTRCLLEFQEVCQSRLNTLKPIAQKHLAVLRAFVFEEWNTETMEAVFEGSKDCLYQWKRRGVKTLWPHISEEFRTFLATKPPTP